MGESYKVSDAKSSYNVDEVKKSVSIVNGIIAAIKSPGMGWTKGHRNTMAVDFCCACYVLDIDPNNTIDESAAFAGKYSEIPDAFNRFNTIEPYLEYWDTNGELFNKMLDPDEWILWEDSIEPKDRYISKVIED